MARTGTARRILLDLGLPGRSGLELLQWLRVHPTLSDTRVVVITATPTEENEAVSRELGVDHYLAKPRGLHAWAAAVAEIAKMWGMKVG